MENVRANGWFLFCIIYFSSITIRLDDVWLNSVNAERHVSLENSREMICLHYVSSFGCQLSIWFFEKMDEFFSGSIAFSWHLKHALPILKWFLVRKESENWIGKWTLCVVNSILAKRQQPRFEHPHPTHKHNRNAIHKRENDGKPEKNASITQGRCGARCVAASCAPRYEFICVHASVCVVVRLPYEIW